MTEPLSDRRAAATAGALVAAVVIVLGFGSGIGAVLSRRGGASAAPGTGHDRGTVVQDSGPVSAAKSTRSHQSNVYTALAATGSRTGEPMRDGSMSDQVPADSSPADAPSAGTGSAASPCAGSSLEAAMIDPFVMHFDKAHLETSPGQQVHDALNVDSYVKIHTVLVEDMVAPAVNAVIASLTGVQPFVAHVDAAHLETSPGQQVNDLLDVDGYTKTHTVLLGDMAAPAMHELTDYGCP